MDNSNSNKYISLKTAAGLYGYTRDHLGLMIRQGKLNGKKLGSYYVTTGEWMLDYIKNFADPNHPASRNKLSNKFVAEIFSAKQNIKRISSSNDGVGASKKQIVFSDYNNELGTKILEELKQYTTIDNTKLLTPVIGNANQNVFTKFDSPYAILPIRQMNDGERKKILKESGLNESMM